MQLPAYKLSDDDQENFSLYATKELEKSIREKNVNIDHSNQSRSVLDISLPNQLSILKLSFSSLSRISKLWGCIAIISIAVSLFLRFSNQLSDPKQVILFLIFLFLFGYLSLFFGIGFFLSHTNITSTFSFAKTVLERINSYIEHFETINLDEENKDKIYNEEVEIIATNIIDDQISDLNYRLYKGNLLFIISPLLLSFFIILMIGDKAVSFTKIVAEQLNMQDFEIFKNLTLERFILIILFPLGVALTRDMYYDGLGGRNQLLRQSLVLLKVFKDHLKNSKAS
jgi:hypothetical protein